MLQKITKSFNHCQILLTNRQKDEEVETTILSNSDENLTAAVQQQLSLSLSASKQCGNELKEEEEEEEWARERSGRNTGKDDDEEKQMNLHTSNCTMVFLKEYHKGTTWSDIGR